MQQSEALAVSKAGDSSGIEADEMKVDTSETTPTHPEENDREQHSDEKDEEGAQSGDVSVHDAMETDSKLDEKEAKNQENSEEEQDSKQNKEEVPSQKSEDGKSAPSDDVKSEPVQSAKQSSSCSSAPETTAVGKAARSNETENESTDIKKEENLVREEENLTKDPKGKESTSTKPRRSSARNMYQPRTLRPRTSGRVGNTASAAESAGIPEDTPQKPRGVSDSFKQKPVSNPSPVTEKQNAVEDEDTPRPSMEAKGLVMRIDEAIFVTEDQLDELKVARLTDKKVKPIEQLTFQDLRTYNRDQLRAYCFAYGMARRKKTEMEADMARYLSYWNNGREGFALHEYVPTSSRVIERVEPNPVDSTGPIKVAPSTKVGSGSREGSATPTTSNGKGSVPVKPPSSRGATPSRSGGATTNPPRVSRSQGSSALSSASPSGPPTSTGNSQAHVSNQAGIQRSTPGVNRTAKPTGATTILPRGFGTSFKQRVHARQAGAKFKAAYNGAGPAIVNIVENAAAYFEGKDSPEVILDQAKSYERYQFNVDMLNEIFDGAPNDSDDADDDVEMTGAETNKEADDSPANGAAAQSDIGLVKKRVLQDIATRVTFGKRKAQAAELEALENQFKTMEDHTKYIERTNMRLFQRLERAETKEQIEAVKQEFEAMHKVKFDNHNPPPLVRRRLDKSLPPLVMSDEKCRILRFKVS